MTKVELLAEARAIEEAGGEWRLKHAAAVLGYSVSFLRRSDCPKHIELDTKIPWIIPAEARAWKAARLVPIADTRRAG